MSRLNINNTSNNLLGTPSCNPVWKFLSLHLVLASLSLTIYAAPQSWVASPMQNIFKDTTIPASPSTSISLLAARNEYESAQVCLRNASAFTVNGVAFTNLSKGNDSIPSSALSFKFVEYVFYSTNSQGLTHKVRNAPADYPDALSNITSRAVAANTTQSVWITAKVPKAQAAGVYFGSATINTTAGAVAVPISLEVVAAELPDASAGYANAPMFALTYAGADAITTQYGFPKYSTQWWNILGKMCDNAVANRTNVAYIVPIQLLLDGGSSKSGSIYTFNWSKFDEYVEFYLARGFRRIWAEGLCYEDSGDIWVSTIGGDGLVGSAHANNYLNQFLPALKTHLQEKGWLDKYSMQILDEPRDDQHDEWNAVAALVPPELKIAEPFFLPNGVETHEGLIDQWMPAIALYEQKKTYFDSRQAAGDQKWFYTYGENAGNRLNRLIDTYVYKNRLLFWYAFAFNMDGYLQWGYNWWGDSYDLTVHGDPWIIYPDTVLGTVKSSIREANQRDGVEELELFLQLKATDPTLAQNIVSQVITNSFTYSNSIPQIESERTRLLRAVSGSLGAMHFFEAEDISNVTATDTLDTIHDTAASSADYDRLNANAVNDFITYTVPVQAGTYTVSIRYKTYSGRGHCQLSIDGVAQGPVLDQYSSSQTWLEADLGAKVFATAGNKAFKFTVVGKNASSSAYGLTFDYIKLTPQAGQTPINLAPGGTISGYSSYSSGYGPSKAIDGIDTVSTNWWRGSTAVYPQWIEVDLGSNKQISSTELVGYGNRAYQFQVEAKPNGGTYQTVVDRTASTVATPVTDNFATVTARYVKMTVTGAYNYSGDWTTIQEFKIFGN